MFRARAFYARSAVIASIVAEFAELHFAGNAAKDSPLELRQPEVFVDFVQSKRLVQHLAVLGAVEPWPRLAADLERHGQLLPGSPPVAGSAS